jgi:hypothetical protein
VENNSEVLCGDKNQRILNLEKSKHIPPRCNSRQEEITKKLQMIQQDNLKIKEALTFLTPIKMESK